MKAVLAGILAALAAAVAFFLGRGRKRRSGEVLDQARDEARTAVEESRRAAEDEVAASRVRSEGRDRERATEETREREALEARTAAREDAETSELADEANRILDGVELRRPDD